ncbi:hypothetical protein M0G43_09445 [Subsaxibacter sp. CAU 1640]|uniref:hypothetical protein n=1 Tax=Subsaxibacter sp. CAU 1640 TaxID=2933271 RepID=UPI00200628B6|nr:hypothetical protein [Subsaxibacter sp. CAU 1640]MCK7590796.1 hypothetical protein [Subsaxibacter sp. CAU 1640]
MKHLNALVIIFALIFSTSCSKDDNNDQQEIQNFQSSICSNVSGAQAIYWDYSHGLAVPLTQIPTIANPGGQFIHSQYPALGFQMPAGFSAQEIYVPQTQSIGVNVIRNDNNVVWRYVPSSSFQGQVGINDILASEINSMFAFYGFNGTPEVVCTTTSQQNMSVFTIFFGARLLRFGNMTACIWARNMYDTTLNVTFTSVSVSVAPTAEFDSQVFNTFLPISFQLLVIDNGVRDSDLDGTPDNQDNFPFDPTRQ